MSAREAFVRYFEVFFKVTRQLQLGKAYIHSPCVANLYI